MMFFVRERALCQCQSRCVSHVVFVLVLGAMRCVCHVVLLLMVVSVRSCLSLGCPVKCVSHAVSVVVCHWWTCSMSLLVLFLVRVLVRGGGGLVRRL